MILWLMAASVLLVVFDVAFIAYGRISCCLALPKKYNTSIAHVKSG